DQPPFGVSPIKGTETIRVILTGGSGGRAIESGFEAFFICRLVLIRAGATP
ncbi:MAG: hypothetical protein JOY71_12020, partial [Acetobacteraceae bacterium]|nr:hypothetical protein [Acetobacteraceae bacterium]